MNKSLSLTLSQTKYKLNLCITCVHEFWFVIFYLKKSTKRLAERLFFLSGVSWVVSQLDSAANSIKQPFTIDIKKYYSCIWPSLTEIKD